MSTVPPHQVVVIGGGYAGLTTAARIAESEAAVSVILVDAKTQFVERIRLHEIAAGSTPRDLDYEAFMQDRGGAFIQGRVEALDTASKSVRLLGPNGVEQSLEYDTLVYALGSQTDLTRVPGAAQYAVGLDSSEGSITLFRTLESLAKSGGTILIAGGGLTAIEAACEFAERLPGLDVKIAPGRSFGPDAGPGGLSAAGHNHVLSTLQRLNVEIIDGARIVEVASDQANLEDGRSVPFDVCVWGAGFSVPGLAADAGIRVNRSGQIETDDTLVSVSHPDIVAVGDAAEVIADPAGVCRTSCAAGRPMGERAARTVLDRLADQPPHPFRVRIQFPMRQPGPGRWTHPVRRCTGPRGGGSLDRRPRGPMEGVYLSTDAERRRLRRRSRPPTGYAAKRTANIGGPALGVSNPGFPAPRAPAAR